MVAAASEDSLGSGLVAQQVKLLPAIQASHKAPIRVPTSPYPIQFPANVLGQMVGNGHIRDSPPAPSIHVE